MKRERGEREREREGERERERERESVGKEATNIQTNRPGDECPYT